MSWFRMWTDIIDDTKMNHLSDQQYRYFTYLMALASEENNDGKITMPDEDIIWRLRMDSLDTLNNLKDVLENLKIIIWSPGEIVFINWEKRQPKSDNSTARVKAFRDRQKKTGCNGSETDKKRFSNQRETPPDTYTYTDTDKKIHTRKKRDGLNGKKLKKSILNEKQEVFFNKFWERYPKKRSKGQAVKAWQSINLNEQLLETMISKIEQAKNSEEWAKDGGQYIPYPATWLNAEGWEDEYTPINNGWEI